jgi:hypothetical protein
MSSIGIAVWVRPTLEKKKNDSSFPFACSDVYVKPHINLKKAISG